jgi:glycosyltransferase involved in cell wall biosynthesis
MAKLAKYLPEHGWDVLVLCSDERNPIQFDPELASEIPAAVEVRRVRGPFNWIGGRAVSTASDARRSRWLGRFVRPAVRLARAFLLPDRWIGWAWKVSSLTTLDLGPIDVVLSSGPPHSTHMAAKRLASRLAVPFVADLRDDWSSDPFGWNFAPWQDPINAALERRTIRRASHVVVVSKAMAIDVGKRHPSLEPKLAVIPNGFDFDDFEGIERHRNHDRRPPRLLFAGRLLDEHDIGNLLNVVAELNEKSTTVTLDFLGSVEPLKAEQLRQYAGAGWLRIRPVVPHRQAVQEMANADALIVPTLKPGRGSEGVMTGKIFECLAARRPILLIGTPSAARDLLKVVGGGVWADPTIPGSLVGAVKQVLEAATDPTFRGAPDEVIARYDRRVLANVWSNLLKRELRRTD